MRFITGGKIIGADTGIMATFVVSFITFFSFTLVTSVNSLAAWSSMMASIKLCNVMSRGFIIRHDVKVFLPYAILFIAYLNNMAKTFA